MKSLWLNSLAILLLFAGCVSIKPAGDLVPGGVSRLGLKASSLPDSNTASLYKASLDIRKHHLSGLMVIRRMEENSFRVVFTNQVGMTYFDLSVKADSFNVVYCFDPLDKKALLRVLETDFRLLLPLCAGKELNPHTYRNPPGTLYSFTDCNKISRWTMYSPSGDSLLYIGGKSNFADAARITFSGFNGVIPAHTVVENPFIKLKLEMRLLKK